MYLLFKSALAGAIKKAKSAPQVPEMLERRPDAADVPSVTRVAPEVDLDYLEHCSAAYVNEMAWGAAREFARFVAGTNLPEQLNDEELVRGLASMNMARLVNRSSDDKAFELDLLFMRKAPFFSPERYEVDRVV